jgi:phosphoribosylformimino-5-aminoimidazole carboxamide ribotide isomerase
MIIYPAIDLRAGRCVRLRQGDPNAETVFGEDPAAMARRWADAGAQWLHVVNLDGALGATAAQIDLLHRPNNVRVQRPGRNGATSPREDLLAALPVNLRRLHEIRQAVAARIQFGGGLRTLDDIRLALELGADRVVLGTAAVANPELVSDALALWGSERIVVSLDAREGMVATHGWTHSSGQEVIELGYRLQALGVKRVLYTDIARDGMLAGVDLETTARLGDLTELKVIASGGVAGIEDIEALKEKEHFNIDGVIVGQALYTGRLDLAQAIAVARRPLTRRSAGIVPMRRTARGTEFLLLYNHFFDQWQFPRGGVERGEADLDAAVRGFGVETGLPIVTLHADCHTTLEYTCFIRSYDIERTIVYFLAEAGPGEVVLGNANHCEARWVDPNEAWELLTATAPEQLPALDAAQRWLQTA